MALSVGDPAPDFTLHTSDKEPWTLSDHRGQQVVLLFFPGAFTGVCTTELNTINNDLSSYSDATVVGISTDSPFALAEFSKVNGFQFPLLSDHDAEICARYGAKYDHDFTNMLLDRIAKRSAFVVDADGAIAYAEVLESAGDEPDYAAIKHALSNA